MFELEKPQRKGLILLTPGSFDRAFEVMTAWSAVLWDFNCTCLEIGTSKQGGNRRSGIDRRSGQWTTVMRISDSKHPWPKP